jgi:hypothetical protein
MQYRNNQEVLIAQFCNSAGDQVFCTELFTEGGNGIRVSHARCHLKGLFIVDRLSNAGTRYGVEDSGQVFLKGEQLRESLAIFPLRAGKRQDRKGSLPACLFCCEVFFFCL